MHVARRATRLVTARTNVRDDFILLDYVFTCITAIAVAIQVSLVEQVLFAIADILRRDIGDLHTRFLWRGSLL